MAIESPSAAPLSPAVLAILLSLAEGERSTVPPKHSARWAGKHGYMIMKDARAAQGGGIQMGPGTLYGSLDRMMRDGLVEETGLSDDERRRYYRLTSLGHSVLAAELSRLDATVSSARSLGLIPDRGRS
jgi:DNA-binding MarR family transcriptional regulator